MDQGDGGCAKPIKGRCTKTIIDNGFTDEEETLITDVLYSYAKPLGGYDFLESNLALTKIKQGWVDPDNYAYYDKQSQSITLPFGWYSDAIYENPNGTFTISTAPTDIESLLRFPSGSLPTDDVAAKFVLAHEMTHALAKGNPETYNSFKDNVDLPWSIFAGTNSNPIIRRNAGRQYGFAQEVFSDVIAASLYSPELLNQQMSTWVYTIITGTLK